MQKVKIIGQDGIGWSIDKDRHNITNFISHLDNMNITESYIKADIYFFVWHDLILSPRYFFILILRQILLLLGRRKKIIAWITNDITQDRNFLSKKWPVDLWISPSSQISDFLTTHKLKHLTIPFFVSPEKFKRLPNERAELLGKFNIDFKEVEGKLLIGSFQRDSLGSDLFQPKWQKNPDLLIKICKSLPREKYILILAGPRRHYLIQQCETEGIPYKYIGDINPIRSRHDDIFINNLKEKDMNSLYNIIDVYIVTSSSEGGPKAILEASLSKTLIFSTDVGLARDFLHPDLLYRVDQLISLINQIKEIIDGRKDITMITKYKDFNYNRTNSVLAEKNYLSLVRNIFKVFE